MPAITITEVGDLDLGLIRAIAAGEAVSIGSGLLEAVQERCDEARKALRDGRPVYGVNTGMGALHQVRLTGQQQLAHQRNLLLARATGGPPWLEPPEVRAIIAVRLLTFLSGDAAVSAGLCQRLAEMLNSGIVPAVPRTGMGASGEIMQLAHAFGPVAGVGQVLGPDGALLPAPQALRSHGLSEFTLRPEGGRRPDPGCARSYRLVRAPPERGSETHLADGSGRGAVNRSGGRVPRSLQCRVRAW
jgi:histidine ammonia-lyase